MLIVAEPLVRRYAQVFDCRRLIRELLDHEREVCGADELANAVLSAKRVVEMGASQPWALQVALGSFDAVVGDRAAVLALGAVRPRPVALEERALAAGLAVLVGRRESIIVSLNLGEYTIEST